MRLGTRTTTGKILASVVLVGAAASVAGLGTFGGFTSTTDASLDAAAGKIVLSSGGGAQALSVPANKLLPGDTVERSIVLTRAADSEPFGSVTLATAGTAVNELTSAGGLQLVVEQCSVPWVAGTVANTLKCDGTVTPLVSSASVTSTTDLTAATAVLNSSAATANLRAKLTLPASADNALQGKSDTITFTFDATQRAAQAR